MTEPNKEFSIAEEIHKDRRLYIKFAIEDLLRTRDEAVDLLNDVVISLLKNNTFRQGRGKLNFFIKLRMRSRHKDIIKKQVNNKNAVNINIGSKYSITPDHILADLPSIEKEKIFDLVENPIKTYGNHKDKIIVTTKKNHEALVGYSVKIRGLVNIDSLTVKRLSNVLGDEIYISDIIDKKNFVIKVNFDHQITTANCGGNKASAVITNINNSFQANDTLKILTEGDADNKAINNLEMKDLRKVCLNKMQPREKFIWLANMSKIKGRNLGEKISDPKFDNDEKRLCIGDIYLKPLAPSESTEEKQYLLRTFNGIKWENIDDNSPQNKPMTLQRVRYLYNTKFEKNLTLGSIGEIVAQAKRAFGECMNNMRYANG